MTIRIIRLKEVMSLTGLSKSTIYRYSAEENFPKAVPLGGRNVGWVEDEITQWLQDRVNQREVLSDVA